MARPDTGTPDCPTRVLLVSGIYPPDIGGPATHVADLRAELIARGREVSVLTLGDVRRIQEREGVVRIPRRWPWPLRLAAVIRWIVREASGFDVIYATGMHPAAVMSSRICGVPVVVKVVGDPAWERGRRRGLTEEGFEAFRTKQGGPMPLRMMRILRNTWLRLADGIVVPSMYLGEVVDGWLDGPSGARVVPNGVRALEGTIPKAGAQRLQVVWVGRLVAHKRVDRLIDSVARTTDVHMRIIGDGPERRPLERRAIDRGVAERVTFVGTVDHAATMRELAAADAVLLASDYEGLPHVAIEACVVGTPIVGPSVGGTQEVLRDGKTGLLVADASVDGFVTALEKLRDDDSLRRDLAEAARREGERWRFTRTADRVELSLRDAVARRPRVVYLSRTRLPRPVDPTTISKLSVLVRHVRPVLLNTGRIGIRWIGTSLACTLPTGRVVGRASAYLAGPILAVVWAAGAERSAIVCQSPYEGVGAIAASRLVPVTRRPKIIVEVHGDWRTASRLYGSSIRKLTAPLADGLAEWSVRNADAVRAISGFTSSLAASVRDTPADVVYPTFTDLSSFSAPRVPPPSEPTVLFIGALERTKGIDVLLEAWPDVIAEIPTARLVVVGSGTMRGDVEAAALDRSIDAVASLPRAGVASAIDRASIVVVPSRSEGFGRVVLEAMARARPVVASEVGGLTDLVDDEVTGLLVAPGSPRSLSVALADLLADEERRLGLGAAARRRFEALSPDETYDRGTRDIADLARRR